MSNIESRRKNRIILPAAIAAGVLLIALAVLAVVFLTKNAKKRKDPDPSSAAVGSDLPTDIPSVTELISEAPSHTPAPESTEPVPVRISDENSRVIIIMRAVSASGTDGGIMESVTGYCSAEFVNNTDIPLYSANFITTGLTVISASVNGYPARFSITEDGLLTIPFTEELPVNETLEVFFEFRADVLPGDEFALPCFGEEMACEMYASVDSDTPIIFAGFTPSSSESGGGYAYLIDKKIVRLVTAHFHF